MATTVVVALAWSRRWMSDDGFINLRVADQVVHGNGLVFNAGERVEVATSPLWIAVLAAASAILRFADPALLAVLIGALLGGVGIACGSLASLRLLRATDVGEGWNIPLLAVTFVVVTPFLDFSTSGLEGALTWAWLGIAYLLVVLDGVKGQSRAITWFTLGLAPLVRPDVALIAVPLAVAAARFAQLRAGAVVRRALLALWVPLAYQVFRMAYFGLLVTNTALAKEGAALVPARGLSYAVDFLSNGRAAIPLLAGLLAATQLSRQIDGAPRLRLLAIAPIVGAALDATYVVAVGGDYMRGRLLLPALFAALLPVAMIPVRRWSVLVLGVVFAGAAVPLHFSSSWVFLDERTFTIAYTGSTHPVSVGDWASTIRVRVGLEAALARQQHRPTAFLPDGDGTRAVPLEGDEVVVVANVIGVVGIAATRDVAIVDTLGLGDIVGSRIEGAHVGNKAGHEKSLPAAWVLARLHLTARQVPGVDQAAIDAAKAAIACGDIAAAVQSATRPLEPGQALENVLRSWRLTMARWPSDPVAAAKAECSP